MILFLFVCLTADVQKSQSEALQWKTISTRFTYLMFQSEDDVERLNRKIEFFQRGGFDGFFRNSGEMAPISRLSWKIDALYQRVQEILEMKTYERRVHIRVYDSADSLKKAFVWPKDGHEEYRAWYHFQSNTIYLQAGDIHAGMLAHEMAHAVIDNFMKERPPAAAAEILARYVDAHLHD